MSSNLYKRGFTCIKEDDARIIDSNALLAKKMSVKPAGKITPGPVDGDGFSTGLSADVIDVLTADSEETEKEALTAGKMSEAVEAGPSPEELLEQARLEIEEQKRVAEAALSMEREKVLSEAKKQGYQEGYAQGQQEFDEKKRALAQTEKKLQNEYEAQVMQLEPKLIETLTGIYEHIFEVDLSDYRDIIVYLIAGTLRKTEGGRNYIVHVSGEDYPYVSMQKKQIVSGGGVAANAALEIVEDITLSKNQALIETEGGIFDCSLGTQLSELTRKIRLLSYEQSAEE